ncbi:MAG: ABC transporter permease [Draconibacterium sp.]|nr:ABC transporter permease [Draconibacterium sp.]
MGVVETQWPQVNPAGKPGIEFPDIESSTSVRESGEFLFSYEENNLKARGLFTSPEFFDVFSFKIVQGDKQYILSDKNSVVITEDLAQLLGSNNAIGKTIKLNGNDSSRFQDLGMTQNSLFSSIL